MSVTVTPQRAQTWAELHPQPRRGDLGRPSPRGEMLPKDVLVTSPSPTSPALLSRSQPRVTCVEVDPHSQGGP